MRNSQERGGNSGQVPLFEKVQCTVYGTLYRIAAMAGVQECNARTGHQQNKYTGGRSFPWFGRERRGLRAAVLARRAPPPRRVGSKTACLPVSLSCPVCRHRLRSPTPTRATPCPCTGPFGGSCRRG